MFPNLNIFVSSANRSNLRMSVVGKWPLNSPANRSTYFCIVFIPSSGSIFEYIDLASDIVSHISELFSFNFFSLSTNSPEFLIWIGMEGIFFCT